MVERLSYMQEKTFLPNASERLHTVNGEEIILYVREDILTKYIKELTVSNSFIQLNLRNKNWLLGCSYMGESGLVG